jgi:RNA polymerase sigma-70 factor (ECF subfamily)
MTDEKIVELVRNGDKEKYSKIVERYEAKMFYYIKRMINQADEEMEDLVQEVLVAAYENLAGFDTKKKFSSWIYRIAHNKAIDYFKKKKMKINVDLGEKEEYWERGGKLPEDIEIDKQDGEELRKAVNSLEIKYREVIWLYYFEDKNYDEISDILRIPISNVGVLLFRAKEKLKRRYEKK